jgi:peptidoglycan/LPS O-acetylase OafA/YrhL
MSATAPSRSGRFIAGDAIRGAACLTVVLWHVAVAHGRAFDPTDRALGLGEFGRLLYPGGIFMVWIFFTLSGYLIGGPFLRAVVRGDGRVPRIGRYAINRVLRIVPAFWLFTILTLVLIGSHGTGPLGVVIWFAFGHIYDQPALQYNMVQAWTLDIEVVFYLAVPLLLVPAARLLRGRWTPERRALALLALLALIAAASFALGTRGPASGRTVPGSMWAFIPGMALAVVEPFAAERLRGHRFGSWLATGMVLAALALYPVYVYVVDSIRLENVLAAVIVTGVVGGPLVLQWATGRAWRWLDNPVFRWTGVWSYGIYLSHLIVIRKLRPWSLDLGSTPKAMLLAGPVTLVLAVLLGALSFRFVEAPFLQRRLPWRAAEPKPVDGPPAAAEAVVLP